jgi:hypothetical protein
MTKNGTPEMRYAHPWLADVGVDVVGVGALAERGEDHVPVQAKRRWPWSWSAGSTR